MISTLPAWGLGGRVAAGAVQLRTTIDSTIAAKGAFIFGNGSAKSIVLEDVGGARQVSQEHQTPTIH
jgi:hypothetical protein